MPLCARIALTEVQLFPMVRPKVYPGRSQMNYSIQDVVSYLVIWLESYTCNQVSLKEEAFRSCNWIDLQNLLKIRFNTKMWWAPSSWGKHLSVSETTHLTVACDGCLFHDTAQGNNLQSYSWRWLGVSMEKIKLNPKWLAVSFHNLVYFCFTVKMYPIM